MTRWTFFGRILPERIPLSIRLPEHTAEATSFGLRYRATINVDKGQLIVPVIVESPEFDVLTLRNVVESDVRAITDLVGYRHGCSFDIDMVSATCDEGQSVIFGNQIPALQHSPARDFGPIEHELLGVIYRHAEVQMVLEDFREAIRSPTQTGFFCYRAIEAMMQSVKAHPNDADKGAWQELRSLLRLDRSAIDAIKSHSDYPRHGRVSAITDAERAKVFQLTDEIIRRYLAFLRRSKTQLTPDEFPIFYDT